jgi:hypothetical protein
MPASQHAARTYAVACFPGTTVVCAAWYFVRRARRARREMEWEMLVFSFSSEAFSRALRWATVDHLVRARGP